MSRIEKFFLKADNLFRNTAWALRIIIFILCVAWVVPVWKPYVAISRAEKIAPIKPPHRCSGEKEILAEKEYYELREKIVEGAKAKSTEYSPEDYFTDLRKHHEKKSFGECSIVDFNFNDVEPFQKVLNSNIKKGYYTMEQLGEARVPFEAWYNEEYRKRYGNAFRDLDSKESLIWIMWFFVSIYWKGIILSFFLYLARMAEGARRPYWKEGHDGILNIFLDGKARFILAVILWPYYLFKYPYNVVRRIKVEAELRRLGLSFRKLTKAERKTIGRLLISDEKTFRDWRYSFRREHEMDFQRKLAVSLLLTIFIIVFTPNLSRGSPQNACRGPTVIISAVQATADSDSGSGSFVLDQVPDALPGEFFIPDPPRLIAMVRIRRKNEAQGAVEDIGHIPILSDCAVVA